MFDTSSLDFYSVCMSINPKRYEYLCKNFNAVGLKSPSLFQGVRWNRGSNTGCVIAHVSILKMCIQTNMPYVTIYEDDAYPRPDILEKWKEIVPNIPSNCGILKLGNSSYRGRVEKINQHVCRMISGTAFGSHAYIIRKELYKKLVDKMMDLNVPDVAMNWEYYLKSEYKPYVLTFDSQLFIQKNISIDNIISRKGGQRYWYPNPIDNKGITSGKPCENFVDKLIPDESDYIEDMCVIYNSNWKNGKKTGVVTDKFMYTKDEDADLEKISENTWKIKWSKSLADEILRYDKEVNGIKFYTILLQGEST